MQTGGNQDQILCLMLAKWLTPRVENKVGGKWRKDPTTSDRTPHTESHEVWQLGLSLPCSSITPPLSQWEWGREHILSGWWGFKEVIHSLTAHSWPSPSTSFPRRNAPPPCSLFSSICSGYLMFSLSLMLQIPKGPVWRSFPPTPGSCPSFSSQISRPIFPLLLKQLLPQRRAHTFRSFLLQLCGPLPFYFPLLKATFLSFITHCILV